MLYFVICCSLLSLRYTVPRRQLSCMVFCNNFYSNFIALSQLSFLRISQSQCSRSYKTHTWLEFPHPLWPKYTLSRLIFFLYPPNNEVVGGYIGFTPSVCPSVCPSVRLSRLPCPLCNIYSSGWILSILATNDYYHEGVCRTQWPLTLTYIFKVIRPWLRKSCPLCSVYSSGWILFIFGTNDHYH